MKIHDLSPKKQKYVKALANGASKHDAALEAGYAKSVANSVANNIETPDVREAFAELMRLKCPAEKIASRIAEGLDATESAIVVKESGEIVATDYVAWSERRHYARLAAEFGGYYQPKNEDNSAMKVGVKIVFVDTPRPGSLRPAMEAEVIES